jgi:iron complex outermembrane receptor protein
MQFFEFLVGPFGLLRVVSNIDEVEIRGWEIGGNFRIGNHLTLYGGYNDIDTEIIKNSSRPTTAGNKSPYTPDYTADIALDFSHPLGDKFNFTTSLYYSVVGETWFHTVQGDTRITLFELGFPGLGTADYSRTQRNSYGLLDLRIGIATADWSITLFGKNLTDESFLEENITAPEFGGSFIHPGTQRRIGIEFSYRF